MTETIIIGAGQAAASLAIELRALGYHGTISIFGDEATAPYQRPPLSKAYLLGETSEERLLLRPEIYWQEANIDLRLDQPVTAIDLAGKTIITSQQKGVAFDHLVFATGATARRLPKAIGGELENVFCVRTKEDVEHLQKQMTAGKKLVVIGGGYIGLEAAAVARKLGLEVTLIEAQDRILQRVAASETSDYFRGLHKDHGVEILEGCAIERLTGDTCVTGVQLSDGAALDCDLVITGIGVTPNTSLAESAGLTIDNGIFVDQYCETPVLGVWAIGDCASFKFRNETIRVESVGNAIDSANIVAKNIAGTQTTYQPKPWFWSDQYDIKLQIAGHNLGYSEVVARQDNGGVSYWYYNNHHLLAVDAIQDRKAYMGGKKMIENGLSPDKHAIVDPTIPIKNILKSLTSS